MANMLRCTLATGGALVLTVTTDSSFAGQTITCTDGTTTLTQIGPSASPYTVEFKIPNGGTWTISSGTTSTSVTIPSSAELHDIPNGSTITPIDNIQIWLHCANIWDKSYTTIAQVLNDASTLQALIASNNAADYMARSTSWASNVTASSSAMTYIGLDNYCANKLLANSTWRTAICNSTYFESVLNVKTPTMTSNTTPSGVASCSSSWNTSYFDAYIAFTNSNEGWISIAGASLPQYLRYEFPNAIKVVKVKFENHNGGKVDMNGSFQESSDGTTYSDVFSFSTSTATQNGVVVSAYPSTLKKYYRFKCNSYNYPSNACVIAKAVIYGRIDI